MLHAAVPASCFRKSKGPRGWNLRIALQKTDPRCEPAEALTDDDKKSLAELSEIIKAIMEKTKSDK